LIGWFGRWVRMLGYLEVEVEDEDEARSGYKLEVGR
jgi:hypothetical protein